MADDGGGGGGGGAKEEVEGEREVEGKGSGVLLGMKLAVSCLFSSDDQTLAASILQQQGGDTCVYYVHVLLFSCVRCALQCMWRQMQTYWCLHVCGYLPSKLFFFIVLCHA